MTKRAVLVGTFIFAAMCFAPNAMAAEAATPEPSKEIIRKFSKFDSMIDKAVNDAAQTRQSDPLKFIAKDMKSVMGDLGEYKTGKPTQETEQKVVGQLDVVIKMLEESCKKSGAGGSLNPSRPMADSKLGGGPGGIHELTDPKASEKVWGNLSPKQREQILQSKTDGFPPGYETLLQSYYKRLAAEQVTDDKAPAAPANAPTTVVPTTGPSGK
jgi:hypothetical protein